MDKRRILVSSIIVGLCMLFPTSVSYAEELTPPDDTIIVPVDEPPPTPKNLSLKSVKAHLKNLGMPVSKIDKRFDDETVRSICTWRLLMTGEASRGKPTLEEKQSILATEELVARKSMVTGLNISRACQTLIWVVEGEEKGTREVRNVFPVSTGTSGHSTPKGTYRIYNQINGWHESTKYAGAMMYRPKYFNGGIALHGSATDWYVRPYPASHGCVRMLHKDIDKLWKANVGIGTPVRVFGDWT